MKTPHCFRCKTIRELNIYRKSTYVHTDGHVSTYYGYLCRQCNTERNREYRKTKAGKAAAIRSMNKYQQNNKERLRAWQIAKKIPASPCVVCGDPVIHRHHPDIKQPEIVVMLCPLHHKKAHTMLQ